MILILDRYKQHNNGLMGKFAEHEGKKYLIVDDFMLDKLLDRIEDITGFEKFILRFWWRQMINFQTILNVILVTCVIKDDDKFYTQIFLEKALNNQLMNKLC